MNGISSARSIAAIASLPHNSFCCGEAAGMSRKSSLATLGLPCLFVLDAAVADQLAPARIVLLDEARELRRRAGEHLDALRRQPRLEIRRVEDLHDFAIYFRDDLRR